MQADLVIRAPRAIIDGREQSAVVSVREGRIIAIDAFDAFDAFDADGGSVDDAGTDGAQVIELTDDEVLLPGLVDTHVHVNEPGRTEWEGFASATRAAAAGGVTTIIDMPLNSIPSTVTVDALRAKQEVAAPQVHVDVGFWGGAVPDHLGDIEALHEAGVFGFKCFLADSGVEEFPPLDPDQFRAAMTETARLGALLIVHAEDAGTLEAAVPARGRAYSDFLASRPPTAEDVAIGLVIDVTRETGGRSHVLHLSSASALTSLRAARAEGLDLSVESCPHYLALDAEEIADGATQFKCCPPIRDHTNQDELWAGLAAGDIDYVVSDHSPSTADLKQFDAGDFGLAWGGIASLQLGLPAMWSAARKRGHTLADVVRWMATATADRVGLHQKGRLEVGADADFVVFAPEEEWVVDVTALHHKNPVSAWADHNLHGQVRQTWLHGIPITTDSAPGGRLLTRGQR